MEKDRKRHAAPAFGIAANALLEQKQESKRRKPRGEQTKKWLFQRNIKGLHNNSVSKLRLEEQRNTKLFLK